MIGRRNFIRASAFAGISASLTGPALACRDLMVVYRKSDGMLSSDLPDIEAQIRALVENISGEEKLVVMNDSVSLKIGDFYENVRGRMSLIGSDKLIPQTVQSIEKNNSVVHIVNFFAVEGKIRSLWCDDYPSNNFWLLTFESKVLTDLHPMPALNSFGEVQVND